MAHVIVLDSINEDIFVCGVCKSVFNDLQVFLEHKSFKCSNSELEDKLINSTIVQTTIITDSAPLEGTLDLNNRATTSDNKQPCNNDFSCMSCKKRFKKMKSLLAHMKLHNEKPYQCPLCGRCFVQNSHLQRHIATHKLWPNGLNQTTPKTPEADLLSYCCPHCNIVLPNYSHYRAHLKNHLSLKKFKCIQGDCMEFCDTIESLLEHVNTHNVLEYHCHLCKSTFNNLEDIATHQHTHNDSGKDNQKIKLKRYKCTQCDAEFRKSEKLSLHLLTENHKKQCIHCNKIFASDKRLRLHLQIHKKLKPFQCNICYSSFHMKKYLSTHMLKHGKSQFKCTICKYMFKRSDVLQRHMRLHQPKKIFKCPFKDSLDCKKEFSRNDKLKLHIKIHTKNVPINITGKTKIFHTGSV